MGTPEMPIAEYLTGSPPGIPLEEVARVPGMATAKDGYVTPSDTPCFGLEIPEQWIRYWEYKGRN